MEHAAGGINTSCLLYTSDAADERSSVDLGGRRIIKKKKNTRTGWVTLLSIKDEYNRASTKDVRHR